MKYHVEFDVNVPDKATAFQAREWISYMIGYTGKIPLKNPLADEPFDPMFGSVKIERRGE